MAEMNTEQQGLEQLKQANEQTASVIANNQANEQGYAGPMAENQEPYRQINPIGDYSIVGARTGYDLTGHDKGEYNGPVAEPGENTVEPETPAPTKPKRQRVYNYFTNDWLPEDASDKEYNMMLRANQIGPNLVKAYDNGTTDDATLESALGSDAYYFNTAAGDTSSNWATFFGAGALGKLTNKQRENIDTYVNNFRAKRQADEEEARRQAEANHDAQFVVTSGDNTYAVSKEFSDYVKDTIDVLSIMGSEEKPDQKAISNKLIELQNQMHAQGYPIKEWKKGDKVPTKPEDIINNGTANADDKLTMMKILDMAQTRTEYKPQEKSFEEKLREREALREEVALRAKNRELERARTRAGFAGLAATIGDMVRASEGAKVSERDWSRIYDNLNEQERANINNYEVRMHNLNEAARAERAAQAAAAAAAAKDARDKAWERQNMQIKINADAAKAEADRKSREGIAAENNRTDIIIEGMKGQRELSKQQREFAHDRWKMTNNPEATIPVDFGGTVYRIPYGKDGVGRDMAFIDIANILSDVNSYKRVATSSGKPMRMIMKGNTIAGNKVNIPGYGKSSRMPNNATKSDPDRAAFCENVYNIAVDAFDGLTNDAREKITNILRRHQGSITGSSSISGGTTNAQSSGWGVHSGR